MRVSPADAPGAAAAAKDNPTYRQRSLSLREREEGTQQEAGDGERKAVVSEGGDTTNSPLPGASGEKSVQSATAQVPLVRFIVVGTAGCGNGVPMWVQRRAAADLIGRPLRSQWPAARRAAQQL